MSLHFSFDIGCTFCSLKASTKMHLFWIGTNTAAFRTLRLSSQVLDKARVHRHPALDSRLTWPKWSEPNMRSPPLRSRQESTCPPVKVSIYKLQLHPLLLFVSRTKIQSSGRHHRPQLFSWNLYSTRSAHMSISVMLYFHFPWVTLGLKCWFAIPACTLFCGLRPGAEVGGRQSGL